MSDTIKHVLFLSLFLLLIKADIGVPAWGSQGNGQELVSSEKASISVFNKCSLLESKGEYSLAAEILRDNLRDDFSLSNCIELLDFNTRLLSRLSSKITKRTISSFEPQEGSRFEYAILAGQKN